MKNQRFNNKKSNYVEIRGASVENHRDDVSGALRKLKKILEGDNRQKDLAKHEYHEKESIKKKRNKNQARKRSAKEQQRKIMSGEVIFKKPTGTKWMKSRRKRRRVLDAEAMVANIQRKR